MGHVEFNSEKKSTANLALIVKQTRLSTARRKGLFT